MATMTTSKGTVYLVSRSGRLAYPQRDPDQRCRGCYNPRLDWDQDTAAAVGLLVDASIPEDDYRVRSAGAEWLEVYNHLRSLVPGK